MAAFDKYRSQFDEVNECGRSEQPPLAPRPFRPYRQSRANAHQLCRNNQSLQELNDFSRNCNISDFGFPAGVVAPIHQSG